MRFSISLNPSRKYSRSTPMFQNIPELALSTTSMDGLRRSPRDVPGFPNRGRSKRISGSGCSFRTPFGCTPADGQSGILYFPAQLIVQRNFLHIPVQSQRHQHLHIVADSDRGRTGFDFRQCRNTDPGAFRFEFGGDIAPETGQTDIFPQTG